MRLRISASTFLASAGVGLVSITMTPSLVVIKVVFESTPSPSTMVYTLFITSTVLGSPAKAADPDRIKSRANMKIVVWIPALSMTRPFDERLYIFMGE